MGDYLARWNERRDKSGPLALRWVVTSMNISESSSLWMFGHAVVAWSYPAAVQSLTQWITPVIIVAHPEVLYTELARGIKR